MGANVSNQSAKALTTIINKNLTEIVSNARTETGSQAVVKQTINLWMEGVDMKKCPVTVDQLADINTSTLQQTNNQMVAELANRIKNDVSADLKQKLTQANDGLNLGAANVGNVQSKVETYLENNMHNIIRTGIENIMQNDAKTDQEVWIIAKNVTCTEGGFVINQKSLIQLISENVANTIVKNVVENVAVAEVKAAIVNDVSQKNTGLSLSFGGIIIVVIVGGFIAFKTMMPPVGLIIKIAIPAVIGLVLVALVFFLWFKPAKDENEERL
jgi:hypothetical protein